MDKELIKILLVDDDEDDYIITSDLVDEIRGWQIEIDWADNYDLALEIILQQKYDVYLLDYRLGERNGLELLRKAIDKGCKAPMILLTGQSDREIDIEAMNAGAADYLVKASMDSLLLERSIRYSLAANAHQAELAKANAELEIRVEQRTKELTKANASLIEKANELENTIEELQQTQAQLIQTEKMSGLGQLVAGVAHEINNPVSFLYGNIPHAKEYVRDLLELLELYQKYYPEPMAEIEDKAEDIELNFIAEDLPRLLDSMKLGADRIGAIVNSLRNFSRLDEAEMKPVDIHEGIENTLMILQSRLNATPGHPEIKVKKEYASLPKVSCYPGNLNQVFMNLLVNAIDALEAARKKPAMENGNYCCFPATPTITIITKIADKKNIAKETNSKENITPIPHVFVGIADNGPGIPENQRAKIFDPFFTTKAPGKGTGLGLSICYQIIEKHGGTIEVNSQLGEGTEFIINFPVEQSIAK